MGLSKKDLWRLVRLMTWILWHARETHKVFGNISRNTAGLTERDRGGGNGGRLLESPNCTVKKQPKKIAQLQTCSTFQKTKQNKNLRTALRLEPWVPCWSRKVQGIISRPWNLMESALLDFWNYLGLLTYSFPSSLPVYPFGLGISVTVVKIQTPCILEAGNTDPWWRGILPRYRS